MFNVKPIESCHPNITTNKQKSNRKTQKIQKPFSIFNQTLFYFVFNKKFQVLGF